jgi:hypothetical protein
VRTYRLLLGLAGAAIAACGATQERAAPEPPTDARVAPSVDASIANVASIAVAPNDASAIGVDAAPGAIASDSEDASAPEAASALATAPDAGRHSPVRIAGRCVDPIADAMGPKWPKGSPPPIEPQRVDLDGDGNDDWIVTSGADAWEYSGGVYITRGRCAIRVLDWHGGAPSPLETSTRGFLDLEGGGPPCKTNCCRDRTTFTFTWNGRTYQKTATHKDERSCGGLGL